MGSKTIEYITSNPDVLLCETIPEDAKQSYEVGDKYPSPDGDVTIIDAHETAEPQKAKKTIWLNKGSAW